MTKITNSEKCIRAYPHCPVLVIVISNLEFICILVLVIWLFPTTHMYNFQDTKAAFLNVDEI
jgi:hypothetical protein